MIKFIAAYYNRALLTLFIIPISVHAISQDLRGIVFDSTTNQPIDGATITLLPSKTSAVTNITGSFFIRTTNADIKAVEINSVGYIKKLLLPVEIKGNSKIYLAQQQTRLEDVVVVSNAGSQYKAISQTDIAMRGVNNSQEVLRIVPGLFIGQHQGGGKAEQIFLRGFDCDHGTDIALFADGMPVNMVSHAHGQGYADSHFIIPETIESADFKKGPYYAEKGDFCTTGFVNFNTKNALTNDVVKIEAGQFNTFRVIGMINLLSKKAAQHQQYWYVASEYNYTDAYFDNPQHFNRFNLFTKYSGAVSRHSYVFLSASHLYSRWNASGQIPDRAVAEGITGFYGTLDPYEGGVTSRTNFNAQLITTLNNGDLIRNQFYYSYYTFDLHSNFTFFLIDSVNGDEIRQKEKRNLFGYNASYSHTSMSGTVKINTEAGINIRMDATNNTELSHTIDRFIVTHPLKLGDINELSISPYVSETFSFNNHFSLNAGLRFDQFFFKYNNKLPNDTILGGVGIYKANANTLSPKLNFYYYVNNRTQFYLTTGKGFHSNDSRSAVVVNGTNTLPAAYGADMGTVFKPAKNVLINFAVWYIYLQQEFVYGGDGGSVEFNGKTRRKGFDFSGRFQPFHFLYFDMDVNYAHARSIGNAKGENYIPLAPVWSTTGGITYVNKKGINGSIRYRYLADRPANENYSLTAQGYFITDAVVNYTKNKYELGLTVNNLFNVKWKETQFDTETRLKNEAYPVDEICFTPGTPLALKISVSIFFK